MEQKRILIVGAGGQLGSEFLSRAAAFPQLHIEGMDRSGLDLEDSGRINAVLDRGYGLIINCSGYTSVDRAEDHPDEAFALNEGVPATLAKACAARGVGLFHFSTDYVFDGQSDHPYTEEDQPNPLNVYGASKAAGEQAILNSGARAWIFRISWLYAEHSHNFFRTMLRMAKERSVLNVVDDQVASPTYAGQLVKDLYRILIEILDGKGPEPGIYHYSLAGEVSWKGFAEKIFEVSGIPCRVQGVSTADFGAKALRPAYSKLDSTKLTEAAGIQPISWEDGLRACVLAYHSHYATNEH